MEFSISVSSATARTSYAQGVCVLCVSGCEKYMYIYIYLYTRTYIYVGLCVCMFVCVYICIDIYQYLYLYHIYIHSNIYIYIYIYIHTYLHIYVCKGATARRTAARSLTSAACATVVHGESGGLRC